MDAVMEETKLAAEGGTPVIGKDVKHPVWPVITPGIEKAVVDQLHDSVSIYNRSGVFEEFEDKFAALHGKKYALLNNSGTNSILAMFSATQLKPGDEVLCPTYTFFATNGPLLSLGLKPVFCDADEQGNFSADDAAKRITDKTKAIIITHMWGYPCDMDSITALAKKHNLLLFEDCSHAHLATYKGKPVGSFGDVAAWSLQGQKNLTGGEGGIMVTDDEEVYIRANLLGHYNKRCKQVIPESHPLYKFAVTGMGLKFRAHPLAIAIAHEQLEHFREYQDMRNYCADQYEKLFADYDFIEMLSHDETEPSWYAFIVKYNQPKGSDITREKFAELLLAEGLAEVDIPGSTGPNHELPLFTEPHTLFPQFYAEGEAFNTGDSFPGAMAFYNSIVKFPVWTQQSHKDMIELYVQGLRKVLEHVSRSVK